MWMSSYLNLCTDCKYHVFWILRLNSLILMLLVNFKIFSLFLCMCEIFCLLILTLSATCVPFLPFCKSEIIVCLSFIERTDCFCCVDIALWFEFTIDWSCVYISNTESSMTFNFLSNITTEPIRIRLNASE